MAAAARGLVDGHAGEQREGQHVRRGVQQRDRVVERRRVDGEGDTGDHASHREPGVAQRAEEPEPLLPLPRRRDQRDHRRVGAPEGGPPDHRHRDDARDRPDLVDERVREEAQAPASRCPSGARPSSRAGRPAARPAPRPAARAARPARARARPGRGRGRWWRGRRSSTPASTRRTRQRRCRSPSRTCGAPPRPGSPAAGQRSGHSPIVQPRARLKANGFVRWSRRLRCNRHETPQQDRGPRTGSRDGADAPPRPAGGAR